MHSLRNLKYALFIGALGLLLMPVSLCADIYRYEDEEGVIHFTDIPTDSKFKIFMRDIK